MNSELDESLGQLPEDSTGRAWRITLAFRIGLFGIFLLVVGIYLWPYREYVSLDYLASQEQNLRDYQARQPLVLYGLALALYVGSTGTGLPIAATLTITYGWLFPFLPALLITSFGSTGGASLAFLSSRHLFREPVQRWFGKTLDRFEHELQREGAFYLFVTRLIPQIPFLLVNVLMGLTPIRLRTFWIVSQIAMLPGTLIYLWIGSSLPNLRTIAEEGLSSVVSWQLLLGMAAVGLVPLVLRLLLRWFLAKPQPAE